MFEELILWAKSLIYKQPRGFMRTKFTVSRGGTSARDVSLQYDVIQLERRGDLCRVKVTRVSDPNFSPSDIQRVIPTWVKSSEITWVD